MRILGIETSCDETGVAIYDSSKGILANVLNSQIIHSHYGGVVPELASREHIINIIPLIKTAFKKANTTYKSINAIAYTAGPGLVSSLIIGATISQALALSWNIPAIPINHMEAHLLSPMLEENHPKFPFIALLISGGHTQIISAAHFGKYELLGESVDDALGEAFDKVATLLGLPYPGGAELSKLAKNGRENYFIFPRPMINHPGLNFSFSGLKTFSARTIAKNDRSIQTRADIALAFQNAVIEVLISKCKKALKQTRFHNLVIAGGVSANYTLRKAIKHSLKYFPRTIGVFYPRLEFCTDNGAMIAYAGMIRNKYSSYTCEKYVPCIYPRWSLEELSRLRN